MYRKFYILIVFFILNFPVYPQCRLKVVNKPVNFGRHIINKSRKIDVVVIHSVYNAQGGDKYDVGLVVRQFSHYRVSSHYVIGRDGAVYRLVKEKDIAYHAGHSLLPDGRTAVNSCSIGIELITDSLDSPTPSQVNSLAMLVKDIQSRYKIKYVLRHSDIAPGRKTDPWNLNWEDFQRRITR